MLRSKDYRPNRKRLSLAVASLAALPFMITVGCSGNATTAGDMLSFFGIPAARSSGSASAASEPPTINGPADMTVECDGAGNTAALNAWITNVTFTQGCGNAVLSNDFTALSDGCGATGSARVTWTVTDSCNQTATHTATFTIVDTTAPALVTPAAVTVTCGDPNAPALLQSWLASATTTDTCGAVTITHQRTVTPGNCTATITWTATDACGNPASASSTYTINGDTTAPTMTLNGSAEMTLECSRDTFIDPGVTLADDCDVLITPDVTGSVDTHHPGDYTLTYRAVDACGNSAPQVTRLVHVVDTQPPTLVSAPPHALWPPNHQLVTLTLNDIASVIDACDGPLDLNTAADILSVYSDEPDNTNGDGNTSGDIAIVNAFTVTLRAERTGGGNGRVYGVHFEVSDSSGNTADFTVDVVVPHDQSGQAAVDDGPAAGQTITP